MHGSWYTEWYSNVRLAKCYNVSLLALAFIALSAMNAYE